MLTTENHKWFKVVSIKISFEDVDSWAKSLLFRTHHLWNATTELTLICSSGEFQNVDTGLYEMPHWFSCNQIHKRPFKTRDRYFFNCLLCRFSKFIVNGVRLVVGQVANLWILFVAKQHPLLDIERRMMILKVLQSSRSAFFCQIRKLYL